MDRLSKEIVVTLIEIVERLNEVEAKLNRISEQIISSKEAGEGKLLLTRSEVAECFGVSYSSVRRLEERGLLKRQEFSWKALYAKSDVEKLLNNQKHFLN